MRVVIILFWISQCVTSLPTARDGESSRSNYFQCLDTCKAAKFSSTATCTLDGLFGPQIKACNLMFPVQAFASNIGEAIFGKKDESDSSESIRKAEPLSRSNYFECLDTCKAAKFSSTATCTLDGLFGPQTKACNLMFPVQAFASNIGEAIFGEKDEPDSSESIRKAEPLSRANYFECLDTCKAAKFSSTATCTLDGLFGPQIKACNLMFPVQAFASNIGEAIFGEKDESDSSESIRKAEPVLRSNYFKCLDTCKSAKFSSTATCTLDGLFGPQTKACNLMFPVQAFASNIGDAIFGENDESDSSESIRG